MNLRTALRLGRVSNLPTVWTNVLAGLTLSGAVLRLETAVPLLLALSAMYVGGMYLNDAFDREIDAKERPERPIPSGAVSASTVFVIGFGLLAVADLALWLLDPRAGAAGVALAAAIVLYDVHHKNNVFGPVVMGVCRMLVYVVPAVTVDLAPQVGLAALVLFAYLIGLTYAAKQENLGRLTGSWPLIFIAAPIVYGASRALETPIAWLFVGGLAVWVARCLSYLLMPGRIHIPRAVVGLIAGISLVDAVAIAGAANAPLAAAAVGGFLLTLLFQRYIPGT